MLSVALRTYLVGTTTYFLAATQVHMRGSHPLDSLMGYKMKRKVNRGNSHCSNKGLLMFYVWTSKGIC